METGGEWPGAYGAFGGGLMEGKYGGKTWQHYTEYTKFIKGNVKNPRYTRLKGWDQVRKQAAPFNSSKLLGATIDKKSEFEEYVVNSAGSLVVLDTLFNRINLKHLAENTAIPQESLFIDPTNKSGEAFRPNQ